MKTIDYLVLVFSTISVLCCGFILYRENKPTHPPVIVVNPIESKIGNYQFKLILLVEEQKERLVCEGISYSYDRDQRFPLYKCDWEK